MNKRTDKERMDYVVRFGIELTWLGAEGWKAESIYKRGRIHMGKTPRKAVDAAIAAGLKP